MSTLVLNIIVSSYVGFYFGLLIFKTQAMMLSSFFASTLFAVHLLGDMVKCSFALCNTTQVQRLLWLVSLTDFYVTSFWAWPVRIINVCLYRFHLGTA